MTTWHTGESPDEGAFFFVFNTNFDDISFDRFRCCIWATGPTSVQWAALSEPKLARWLAIVL
jgi:hypothetical protein